MRQMPKKFQLRAARRRDSPQARHLFRIAANDADAAPCQRRRSLDEVIDPLPTEQAPCVNDVQTCRPPVFFQKRLRPVDTVCQHLHAAPAVERSQSRRGGRGIGDHQRGTTHDLGFHPKIGGMPALRTRVTEHLVRFVYKLCCRIAPKQHCRELEVPHKNDGIRACGNTANKPGGKKTVGMHTPQGPGQ